MANIYNGTVAPTITIEFDLYALGPNEPGASIWTPVPTADIRALSVRRGKSVENQAVQPGVLTLTLNNQSGDYDPEKMASPWTLTAYATTISAFNPRLGVRVKATWNSINYTLYQGYMETLDLDYGLNPTATLTFTDGLAILAAKELAETASAQGFNESVYQRAVRISDELVEGVKVWPTGLRNYRSGLTTLLYGTYFNDTALNLIQTAADCYPARVHVSNDGKLTVCQWDYGVNRGLVLSDTNAAGVIGYDSIEIDPGAKYLVNSVTVTKVDGTGANRGVVPVINSPSILKYGLSSKTYELPVQEAKPVATFLANQYANPVDRVKSVSFSALNFASQFPKLLATELADFCQVVRNTMDGRTLSFNCQVEGIEYDLTPEDWRVRFITSTVATIPSPTPGPEPTKGETNPPSPPTSLTGTTAAYIDFRDPKAQVSLTWVAPTTNADGTELTDLRWYEVQYKLSSSSTWLFGGISYSTAYVQSGLTVNTGYDFRAFAVDSSNNRSAASNTFTITSANVTTFVGATPSTPIVSSRLGTLTIEWDGKNNGGGAMPSDFWFLEVHVSTVNNFTPTSATYKAQMLGASTTVLANLVYGTTYYVKFVAYNKTSIASTPSAQASATILRLVDTDLIASSLSTWPFVNGTVNTAALADGSINAAKILTGAVIQDKIAANAIGATQIAANAVVAGKIGANAVTAGTIAALAVSAGNIQANAITADKIDVGAVTAEKLSATAIDGKVITGSTLRTSAGLTSVNIESATNSMSFRTNGSANGHIVPLNTGTYVGGVMIHYGASPDPSGASRPQMYVGSDVVSLQGSSTAYISIGTSTITVEGSASFGGNLAIPFAPTTSSFSANAFISSPSGIIYRVTSSERYKTDIQPAALSTVGVLALEPKTFVDKNAAAEAQDIADVKRGLGLIAEEVAAIPGVGDLLVNRDEEGRPDSINYDRIAVALIDVIKDLSARVAALEASN